MSAPDLQAAKNTGRRVCKECGVEKDYRIYHRRGNTNYYQDDNGKLWSGRLCSPCSSKLKTANQYPAKSYPASRVIAERKKGGMV